MFLGESTYENQDEDAVVSTGEIAELMEHTIDCLNEQQNLTMAIMRLEYRSLTESAAPEVLNEGVAEFFTRVKTTLVGWWKRFVAFITSTYQRIKAFFFGSKLPSGAKDEDGKTYTVDAALKVAQGIKTFREGAEVSIGSKVLNVAPDNAFKSVNTDIKSASDKNFKEAFEAANYSGKSKDQSVTEYFKEKFIGDTVQEVITPALAKKVVSNYEAGSAVLKSLDSAKKIAEEQIRLVETIAAAGAKSVAADTTKEDKKGANEELKSAQKVAPLVGAHFSAMITVFTSRQNQLSSALGKIINSELKKGGKKEVKNEGASVLDSFIG